MNTIHYVLYSGGMDSFTLLHEVLSKKLGSVCAISFDYGQRHRRELDAARSLCLEDGIRQEIIDLTSVGVLLKGSSQTDQDVPVPKGHYTDETMRLTVVPGRNTLMLAAALSLAESECVQGTKGIVYYAAHSGDHYIYPDCRPGYVSAMRGVYSRSSERRVTLRAPFLMIDKGQILKRGLKLSLNYARTWTCYVGEERPCGGCGACVERAEAFTYAQARDPLLP